jgi:hypothetical protein
MNRSLPFSDFLIRLLRGEPVNPTPNPEPGRPGLRIFDPRRQGDQVTPPGTVYLF